MNFFGAVSKERFQGNSFCKKGPQAFFQGEKKIMKVEIRIGSTLFSPISSHR